MRDVAYHLMISCDEEDLAAREHDYVEYYVDQLKKRGRTYAGDNAWDGCDDNAWDQYRLHALWALAALLISAGAKESYFAAGPAKLTIRRVAAAMERVDTRGALEDVIAADDPRTG